MELKEVQVLEQDPDLAGILGAGKMIVSIRFQGCELISPYYTITFAGVVSDHYADMSRRFLSQSHQFKCRK